MSMGKKQLEEDWVINRLAKRLYVDYCKQRGFHWEGKTPDAWAVRYATVAVDYLGWDEDSIDRLANDPELEKVA